MWRCLLALLCLTAGCKSAMIQPEFKWSQFVANSLPSGTTPATVPNAIQMGISPQLVKRKLYVYSNLELNAAAGVFQCQIRFLLKGQTVLTLPCPGSPNITGNEGYGTSLVPGVSQTFYGQKLNTNGQGFQTLGTGQGNDCITLWNTIDQWSVGGAGAGPFVASVAPFYINIEADTVCGDVLSYVPTIFGQLGNLWIGVYSEDNL